MKSFLNKYYGLMAMLALSPLGAFAASSSKNFMDKAVGLQDRGGDVLGLIFNGCLIFGIGLIAVSAYAAYDKYAHQQSQTKWGKIIAGLAAGGILMSLKYFSGDVAAMFESDNEGPKKQTVNW